MADAPPRLGLVARGASSPRSRPGTRRRSRATPRARNARPLTPPIGGRPSARRWSSQTIAGRSGVPASSVTTTVAALRRQRDAGDRVPARHPRGPQRARTPRRSRASRARRPAPPSPAAARRTARSGRGAWRDERAASGRRRAPGRSACRRRARGPGRRVIARPSASRTPGFMSPSGSKPPATSPRTAMPELALLGRQLRRVVAPDAVLVADRAAVARRSPRSRRVFSRAPAVERLVRVGGEPEDVRRVQARAARVDVREVAERVDALAVGRRGRGGAPGRRPRRGRAAASSRPPSRACRPRSRPPRARSRRSGARNRSRSHAGRASRRRRTPAVPPDDRADLADRDLDELLAAPLRPTSSSARLGPDAADAEVGAERADAAAIAGQREQRRGLERGREADHRQRRAAAGASARAASSARGQSRQEPAPATPRRAGFGTTRTVASVRIPSRPSEPRTSWRRSGPAADAGCGGISSVPAGASSVPPANSASIRPSPMRLLAGRARRDPAADRRRAPTTAGSGRGSARAARAPPRGPARSCRRRTSRARSARRGRGGRLSASRSTVIDRPVVTVAR